MRIVKLSVRQDTAPRSEGAPFGAYVHPPPPESDPLAPELEENLLAKIKVPLFIIHHTVQTKKFTQNVGRSILVPDFGIWRPLG